MDIVIPNLGDIDEVEVIELCVAVGDVLETDDAVIVIESDKASMEIPAPAGGVLETLTVSVGDRIGEGHVIGTITADTATESSTGKQDQAEQDQVEQDQAEPDKAEPKQAEPKRAEPKQPEDTKPDQAGTSQTPAAVAREVEVLVPDIGDAAGVVVIEVAVKPGDEIHKNDLLVVLESDKASMEIAAEYDGTVVAVLVEEGQEVEEGTHIVTLQADVRGDTPSSTPAPASTPAKTAAPQETVAAPQAPTAAQSATPAKSANADIDSELAAAAKVYAGPAVRRLARELGVSLQGVKGTGNRNRITKDDVKAFVKQQMQSGVSNDAGSGLPRVPVLDYAKFGPIQTLELTRIQRRGADNLHRSWINLPHVTQHDEADITDLETFRKSLKAEGEQKGIKVTPLAFLVKACCRVLQEFPMFNASLHEDHQQLILKQYYNIGMAVDTPEGLVVPVIKNADQKSIWDLSAEIAELSDKARNKKLAMDDLQGGTFSISSLGALGGTGFTPIVNAPEVAILGVSKLATKPLWDGSNFQPRQMLPLSLSYDHRVINGADGGRFMLSLTTILSDIRRLAL